MSVFTGASLARAAAIVAFAATGACSLALPARAAAGPAVVPLPERIDYADPALEIDDRPGRPFADRAAAVADFRERLGGTATRVDVVAGPAPLGDYRFSAVTGMHASAPARSGSALIVQHRRSGRAWIVFGIFVDQGLGTAGRAEFFDSPAGPWIRMPVRLSGTGALHHDFHFLWRDGMLQEIDTQSWLQTLRLEPLGFAAGAGIWKGVTVNPENFTARTAVWQRGDANCCPSGGAVEVELELRDRVMVVKRAVAQRSIR